MSSVDLLLKDVFGYFEHMRVQMEQARFWLEVIFGGYLFCSLTAIRLAQKRLERLSTQPVSEVVDDQFLTVTETDILNFRIRDDKYDVPKLFPMELERFVKAATYADMAEWILELGDEKDQAKFLDIKRAVTISAAIHRVRIPKTLIFIDNRTKALWVRLGFDLELRHVDHYYVHQHVPICSSVEAVPIEERTMATYNRELAHVGALILQYSEKGVFPCFHSFLGILTDHRDLSKELMLNSTIVQSLVTAYAVKSGLKIPASYVRCDLLTWQLLDLDQTIVVA